MGAFNQLNGAIFDAGAIEARLSAVDGKSIYNQRDGSILDLDSLARRLAALDGKIAVGQGGIEFDVDSLMRRLAAIEAGVFTPLSLFAAGEQGAWYDPSDFSTLFQDSAGTTPVNNVGQPVGFIGDKRTGSLFGPELISSGTSGWTSNEASLAAVGSQLQLTTAGAGSFNTSASRTFTTVIGATYTFRGRLYKGTCVNTIGVNIGATTAATNATTTPANFGISYTAVATSTVVTISIAGNETGTTAFFENLSLEVWTGNHATQATTTSRPNIQQDGSGRCYLAPDGVDDNLQSVSFTMPATATMAAAAQITNAGSVGNLFCGSSISMLFGVTTGNIYRMYQGATLSGGTRDSANHVLLANFLGTASSSLELDKSVLGTATAGTQTLTGGINLFSSGGSTQFMSGSFYGGLAISRALTASEKSSLYTYLGAKAGLSL